MARGELPRAGPAADALVDNHAHLDSVRSDAPGLEVSEAIAAAAAVGVDRVVQIGCEVESARSSVVMAHTHPRCWRASRCIPTSARLAALGELDAAYAVIGALALDPRVRTVGETGLDYYRTGPGGREIQHDAFRWHIALARKNWTCLQITTATRMGRARGAR